MKIQELKEKFKLKEDSRVYTTLGGRNLIFHGILIEDDFSCGHTKRVSFLAPIYLNKIKKVSFSFDGKDFPDHKILMDRDLMTLFLNSYGAGDLS